MKTFTLFNLALFLIFAGCSPKDSTPGSQSSTPSAPTEQGVDSNTSESDAKLDQDDSDSKATKSPKEEEKKPSQNDGAQQPEIYAGELDSDGLLRSEDGRLLHLSQPEAMKACPEGTRLPTIRELAKISQTRGAKGILEANQDDEIPAGYEKISAINFDGQEDEFYFSREGYKHPEGDLGESWMFWSSSVHSSFSYLAWYLNGYSSQMAYVSGYKDYGAVMCVPDHLPEFHPPQPKPSWMQEYIKSPKPLNVFHRDQGGLQWGTIPDLDGVKNLLQNEARILCESKSARLPTVEEFRALALEFGSTDSTEASHRTYGNPKALYAVVLSQKLFSLLSRTIPETAFVSTYGRRVYNNWHGIFYLEEEGIIVYKTHGYVSKEYQYAGTSINKAYSPVYIEKNYQNVICVESSK